MRPELNRSVSEINADDVHGAPTNLKGAGVVIGVIDSGFDIHHQNFRRPDGTSRILAIWDQRIDPGDADALPGEHHPANFAVGVEYDRARIRDALTIDRRLVRTNDRDDDNEVDGHGTHVTGIAAGDGSQAGNCRGTFVFVGVAPEADIILVRLRAGNPELGRSTNLVDALEWIWRHPETADRPVVVNISLGDNMGAHDGTSPVEMAIEVETLIVPGHVVVKSAGNAGDDHQHAEGTVSPGNPVPLRFTVRGGDKTNRHLDLWYRGAGRLDAQLIAPGPGAPTSQVFHPGDAAAVWVLNPGVAANRQIRAVVDSETDHGINGDHRIHVLIDPGSRARTPAGPWQLVLTNTGAVDVPFDAWFERGTVTRQDEPPHHDAPFFTSHMTTAKTISVPGTTVGAITVGNYADGLGIFFDSTGEVHSSSSRGPTRDNRTKPDLSAPGVSIKSTAAEEKDNCCCDCCENFYVDLTGTSMSAPHVTGVVALMLQRNPTLPAAEVKRILMQTARAHGGGSPNAPDNVIGAGKVDALAAVNATPPPAVPVPPPGGGGGGGADVGGAGVDPRVMPVQADRIGDWLRSDDGQLWAALVSTHLSEVRGLIATNRRVAGFWQLLSGPQLLRAAEAFVLTGDPVLLAQFDPAEIDRRAAGFLRVLAKYGSPRLRRDVERHGERLVSLGCEALLVQVLGRTDMAA
jgi:subtilisin family serine protease